MVVLQDLETGATFEGECLRDICEKAFISMSYAQQISRGVKGQTRYKMTWKGDKPTGRLKGRKYS